MRLLVAFPSVLRGGAEEFALSAGKGAVRRGHEVIAAFPDLPSTERLAEDFRIAGVECLSLAFSETIGSPPVMVAKYLRNLGRALRCLRRVRPDVVLANAPWPTALFGMITACALRRIPTAVVFHMLVGCDRFDRIQRPLRRWALARSPQRLATVTNPDRAKVAGMLGIPPENVARLHVGVPVRISEDAQPAEAARGDLLQELGLPEESRLVLTVANLSPVKNHDLILKVAERLCPIRPEIHFVWAGQGELEGSLRERAQALGLAGRIHFLGFRADIPRLLAAADLFLLPSRYETCPIAVLEAMVQNVPMVLSDAGHMLDLVEPNVHALVFHSEDDAGLERQLCAALDAPDRMRELATQARARAQAFSEDRMQHEILELLEACHADAVRSA